jgi:hypothetical protein
LSTATRFTDVAHSLECQGCGGHGAMGVVQRVGDPHGDAVGGETSWW